MTKKALGFIPATGSGVQARSYTYEIHKGMFVIDGKPNIERHIDVMRDEMGIDEIVIVLGCMAGYYSVVFWGRIGFWCPNTLC